MTVRRAFSMRSAYESRRMWRSIITALIVSAVGFACHV
jgi:hypothetical protein